MKIFSRAPLRYIVPPLFFRYLLIRLVQPFFIVLAALTTIWIMVDLYGNLDTFLEKKVHISQVLYFYALQLPATLPVTLPATMLFSSLFTLLSLNRRSELVAFESGGISPIRLFFPFLTFSVFVTAIMALDLFEPAPWAELQRQQIMLDVRGTKTPILIYRDPVNYRSWFFQKLDVASGIGTNVTILCQDAQRHDTVNYGARTATWDPVRCLWLLKDGICISYGPAPDQAIRDTTPFDSKELNATTPPKQMLLVNTPSDQLSLHELNDFIQNTGEDPKKIAECRTEWWYRFVYPTSLVILLIFALTFGMQGGRQSALPAIVNCITVFLVYFASVQVFRAIGHGKSVELGLSPIFCATFPEITFALLGIFLFIQRIGWLRLILGVFSKKEKLPDPMSV